MVVILLDGKKTTDGDGRKHGGFNGHGGDATLLRSTGGNGWKHGGIAR